MVFIDTHCHLNMMVKKSFDTLLSPDELSVVEPIVLQANQHGVQTIINVGTSFVESINSIEIAKRNSHVYATIGIHPTDCTPSWKKELSDLAQLLKQKKELKIAGIGECGLDFYHPNFDVKRQQDAFKAQIELSLEHDIALVVHSRDAYQETLKVLEEYKNQISRGIIHCFSYDLIFATTVVEWGFTIGLGGAITYPKNGILRTVADAVPLTNIVLETDAPFLPPQVIRGKQNHPQQIVTIAQFIADIRTEPLALIAQTTTQTAQRIFNL